MNKCIKWKQQRFILLLAHCFIISHQLITTPTNQKETKNIAQLPLFMHDIYNKNDGNEKTKMKASMNHTLLDSNLLLPQRNNNNLTMESEISFLRFTDFLNLSSSNFTKNTSMTPQPTHLLPFTFIPMQKITPSLTPSWNPSSNPSSSPSSNPSFFLSMHPSLHPSARPSSVPTKDPTTSPSESFSPSSRPTPMCHDLASYRNPLNRLGCSTHRGTPCEKWAHLGLTEVQVLELIQSCPESCKINCGVFSIPPSMSPSFLPSFEPTFPHVELNSNLTIMLSTVNGSMSENVQQIFVSTSKKYFMSYFHERTYPIQHFDLTIYSQEIITKYDRRHRGRRKNMRQLLRNNTSITSSSEALLVKVNMAAKKPFSESLQLNDTWFKKNLIEAIQNEAYTISIQNSGHVYLEMATMSYYNNTKNTSERGISFNAWKKISMIIVTSILLLLFIIGGFVHCYSRKKPKAIVDVETPHIVSPTNSLRNTVDHDKCYSPPPQISSSPSSLNLTSPDQSNDDAKKSVSSDLSESNKQNNAHHQRPLSLITHNDDSIPPLVVIENIDDNFSAKDFLRHSLNSKCYNERSSHPSNKQEENNNLSTGISRLKKTKEESKRGFKHRVRPFSTGDEKHFFPKPSNEGFAKVEGNRKRNNPSIPINLCSPSARKILSDCNIYDPNPTKKNVSFKTEHDIPGALDIIRGRSNSETSSVSILGDGIPLPPGQRRAINTLQYTKRSEGYDSDVSGGSGLTSISNFSSSSVSKLDVVALKSSTPQKNYQQEQRQCIGKSDRGTFEKKNTPELQNNQSLRDELSRKKVGATFRYTFDAPSSGKLGIIIESTENGGPTIHTVKDYSPLFGMLVPGDLIIQIDDENTYHMNTNQLTKLLTVKRREKKKRNEVIKISILSCAEKAGIPFDSVQKSINQPNKNQIKSSSPTSSSHVDSKSNNNYREGQCLSTSNIISSSESPTFEKRLKKSFHFDDSSKDNNLASRDFHDGEMHLLAEIDEDKFRTYGNRYFTE